MNIELVGGKFDGQTIQIRTHTKHIDIPHASCNTYLQHKPIKISRYTVNHRTGKAHYKPENR